MGCRSDDSQLPVSGFAAGGNGGAGLQKTLREPFSEHHYRWRVFACERAGAKPIDVPQRPACRRATLRFLHKPECRLTMSLALFGYRPPPSETLRLHACGLYERRHEAAPVPRVAVADEGGSRKSTGVTRTAWNGALRTPTTRLSAAGCTSRYPAWPTAGSFRIRWCVDRTVR